MKNFIKKVSAFSVSLIAILAVGTAPIKAAPLVVDASTLAPAYFEGNDTGVEHPPTTGEKVDNPVAGGVYTVANGNIKITLSEDGKTMTVEELDEYTDVAFIHVKGGNGYYIYTIPTEATMIINLVSPLNAGGNIPEISHFTIFVSYVDDGYRDVVFEKYAMIDNNKVLLDGAVFDLYKDNEPFNSAGLEDEVVAANIVVNGQFATELLIGKYYLKEVVAPVGYDALAGPVFFAVGSEKDSYKIEVENFKTIVYNLKIVKLDSVTEVPLIGAVFSLNGMDKNLTSAPTTSSGEVLFSNLLPGEYEVCEVVVPVGYLTPQEPCVVVQLTEDSTITFLNVKRDIPDTGLFDNYLDDVVESGEFIFLTLLAIAVALILISVASGKIK